MSVFGRDRPADDPRPDDSDDAGVPPGPLAAVDDIPDWLRGLCTDVDAVTESVENRGGDRTRIMAAFRPARRSAAVLIAFGGAREGTAAARTSPRPPDDADVLLTQRAAGLRNHAGQIAFPGGGRDPGDDFPVGTALREATEETGLDPADLRVLARLRSFPVPPSGFDVVPVVAWSPTPGPVRVVDPGETARVARVPIADLLDPSNRFQVQRTVMGGRIYRGPAFTVADMLIWGFTGGLLAAIFDATGWTIPWDTDDVRDLDGELERAGQR